MEQHQTDGVTDCITLRQTSLVDKILEAVGMTDCNARETPAATIPLGTGASGPSFNETWDYASVVGMLLYLTHSCPEIQFAVHQVA